MAKHKKHEFLLRLPESVVQRIDGIVEATRREKPGLPISRTGVIGMLLESAISVRSAARPRKPICEFCGDTGRIDNDIPCTRCGGGKTT